MKLSEQKSAAENSISLWANSKSVNYWMSLKTARFLSFVLLFVGIECWLLPGRGNFGHMHQPFILLGAVVAALIPPVRNIFNRIWQAVEQPSPIVRAATAFALAIASIPFLYWANAEQNIPVGPKYHDEFSYLVQMRLLAQGRLWLPPHPCGKFFETFYLITDRAYASMYFPGAGMMFVPAIWLHLPLVFAPLISAGICVALVYLIVTEILDAPSGLLAAVTLLAFPPFRMLSLMFMSQIPVLLLGLLMTCAWLHWRGKFSPGWLIVLGAAAGWAAITRPADALAFAVAVGVAMFLDLWRKPIRIWAKTAGILFIAASPFFIIQLIFNHGVTGHWLQTPFTYYTSRFYPGAQFGFHQPPGQMPHVSDLPQKQLFFEQIAWGLIHDHTWTNAPSIFLSRVRMLRESPAVPFFWLFIPLSLPAMWDRRFFALWGVVPAFVLIYTGYVFYLEHYLATTAPAMGLLTVLPIRFLTDIFPRAKAAIRAAMGLAILGLALVSFPQIDKYQMDQHFNTAELRQIDSILHHDVNPPAVVLFHFNPATTINGRLIHDNPEQEPVFNIDVAWPDDAPIIRAHDLNSDISEIGKQGDRDLAIYEYYQRIDPARVFYLFDRRGGRDGQLIPLGTAAEMIQKATRANPQ